MKYYAETPDYFPSASNKLYEAAQAALKEFNRFIFPVKMLPVVKSSIENIIASLNAQHKRCIPLKVKWSDNSRYVHKDDISKSDLKLHLSENTYTTYLHIKMAREESDL